MDKLLYVPNPLLRQKAKKIISVGEKELKIAKKMRNFRIFTKNADFSRKSLNFCKICKILQGPARIDYRYS